MKPETFSKDDRINDGNETPKYLARLKKELERSSYTLRKNFKASNNLRAKIILSNNKNSKKKSLHQERTCLEWRARGLSI